MTPSGEAVGRVVCEHLAGARGARVAAERLAGPYGLVRLRVRVENTDRVGPPDATARARRCGARWSRRTRCIAVERRGVRVAARPAGVGRGRPWRAAATRTPGRCWSASRTPRRGAVVADHPVRPPGVAPESPGDLFDATEIDEILTLRTLTLTDEEKREARATDPRAAAIIDRVDDMPPEMLERLHGAIRSTCGAAGTRRGRAGPPRPWWDPGADASVVPETDSVIGRRASRSRKGSRVRLRPGTRRADAQDMFLAGRTATVEAVLLDVDGARHLAVTLDDDPGAELQRCARAASSTSPRTRSSRWSTDEA